MTVSPDSTRSKVASSGCALVSARVVAQNASRSSVRSAVPGRRAARPAAGPIAACQPSRDTVVAVEARGSNRRISCVARTSARSVSRSPDRRPRDRAWTRTLPSAVASTGPASDRQLAGVGRQLAQERVAGAAADEMDDVHSLTGQARRVTDGPRVGRRQAVEDGRGRGPAATPARAGRVGGRRRRSAPACRPVAGRPGRRDRRPGRPAAARRRR